MFKIFSDGSCKNNGAKDAVGAWAYVVLNDKEEILFSNCNAEYGTTNNRMEMTAILKGIKSILKCSEILEINKLPEIEIYTDSAYIHNCLKQKWYKNWQKNGWVNSSKQPVKNKDLWELLIPYFENEKIHFYKVKGHADDKWNNYVDELAQTAAKMIERKNPLTKIILVNGMPTVGKTLFEKICREELYNNYKIPCEIFSTIKPIKDIAKIIGWDGKKTPKDRKFLSDLKDLCTKYNDYSINWVESQINSELEFYWNKEELIFFIDVREPEEINHLKERWNAKTLLIRRESVETFEQSNHADTNVLMCSYDYVIFNNETKEDLKEKAKSFIMKILNEEWESEVK